MLSLLTVLIVLIAVLLIVITLLQNSKSDGLSTHGISGTSQLVGTHRASHLLERVTWYLIGTLFVLMLFTTRFLLHTKTEGPLIEKIVEPQEQLAEPLQEQEKPSKEDDAPTN